MSPRVRCLLFFPAAAIVAAFYLWGVAGLPAFGHYRGPYGNVLNQVAVPERHVTDVVAAVNFDYRGIDTVGEEFMLFAAVAGVSLLLRTERQEMEDPASDEDEAREEERPGDTSEAVRLLCLVLVAPTVLLGLYVVTHGHLTPGGGFQGGVILAAAPLLIYLAGEYGTLRNLSPEDRVEVADALGAGGFVAIGVAGLIAGGAFLQNIMPLGPVGKIYSAGTIPLINLSVGLEVGAGFLLIISCFLRQMLQVRAQRRRQQ